MATKRALEGLKVLDFGQYIAGPLVAMVLGDHGAEVVRIDPPGGPRWHNAANAILQRNKKSIVLDLKDDADRAIARDLAATADVLIEGFRPGVMDRLGLGREAMTDANPRLVYCSMPGFGRDDPRAALAGWEGIIGAATGHYAPGSFLTRATTPDQPHFCDVPLASSFAAHVALNAILAALIARERTGAGQCIEAPLYNAMFEVIGITGQRGAEPPRQWRHAAMDIHGQAADGRWILVSLQAFRHYRWFAEAFFPQAWIEEGLGDPSRLVSDAVLADRARERILSLIGTRSSGEWEAAIAAIGVPVGRCQTNAEWLGSEQAWTSCSVIELTDPELGPIRQAGFSVTLDETPPRAAPRSRLDGDRVEIIAGLVARDTRPPMASGNSSAPALDQIRVLDLTTIVAGPTAGRILAEYGADVVKINQPGYYILCHLHAASGKRSMLLDITQAEGKTILWRLIARSDVLIHNLSGDAMARLGFSEPEVRKKKPAIIYCSLDVYGHRGPRAGQRGYEGFGQAATGLLVRWSGGGPPPYRFAVCDFATGEQGATAVLLGLFHRLRHGAGQHVRTTLVQAGTYLQIPYMLAIDGQSPSALSTEMGFAPLDRLFCAADGWFYLVVEPALEPELARLTGVDVHDVPALEAAFRTRQRDFWVDRLQTAGLAVHSLLTIEDVMEDPRARAQGLSVVRDHGRYGLARLTGPAARLSRTPVRLGAPAAWPGSETRHIIEEIGLSDQHNALRSKGVIADDLSDDILVLL